MLLRKCGKIFLKYILKAIFKKKFLRSIEILIFFLKNHLYSEKLIWIILKKPKIIIENS